MDKNWEFIEADSYIYENGIYYSPDGKTILANDGSLSGLLSIKNGVTHIEANAFANCDNITDIVMPESVISIGEKAFIGCDGLVSVNLGNGVSTIGNYAFKNCTGLTTLDLGTELQTIGVHAFYRCTGLTEVTIPNSVTSIGSEAFRYCSNIKKLTIGTGLNKIPEYSLGDMKSLEEDGFETYEEEYDDFNDKDLE